MAKCIQCVKRCAKYLSCPFCGRRPLCLSCVCVCRQKDKALARLADYEDDFRRVVSEQCAPDEVHCSCVPHLRRRIAELESRFCTCGFAETYQEATYPKEWVRHTNWCALTSSPGDGPADLAWLVETDFYSTLHYLRGWHASQHEPQWTNDHLVAWRFARREDADKALVYLAQGRGRVVEHAWASMHETTAATPRPAAQEE